MFCRSSIVSLSRACTIGSALDRVQDWLAFHGWSPVDDLFPVARAPPGSPVGVLFHLPLTVDAERGVRESGQPGHRNPFLAVLAAALANAIRTLPHARQGPFESRQSFEVLQAGI